MELTQRLIREHMHYDNGKLFWRISPAQRCKIGAEVGYLNPTGYRQGRFRGRLYYVHRLIFLYHHGYLPENQVDHINRAKDDNRIENLREVSQSCNTRNSKLFSTNTSGIKGVCYHRAQGKWHARIAVKSEHKYLGYHDSKLEASCARLAAEQCLDWQTCEAESPAYKFVKENL